jgi:hypothetical protein
MSDATSTDLSAGERVELGEDDLEYRRLGAARAAQVAAAGAAARAALLAQLAPSVIEPFPAGTKIDPVAAGIRDALRDKVVTLPAVERSEWVWATGQEVPVWGDDTRGWYMVRPYGEPLKRLAAACDRYTARVRAELSPRHEIIARVTGKPAMEIVGGRVVMGLEVDVLAATVGGAVFVDVGVVDEEGVAWFAGERELRPLPRVTAEPGSPSALVAELIVALKLGDRKTWEALVADWELSDLHGRLFFSPYHPERKALAAASWEAARALILGTLHDVRVVAEGPVETVHAIPDANVVIEQAAVHVATIGRFGDEYRAFTGGAIGRCLRVQRWNDKGWRLVSWPGVVG